MIKDSLKKYWKKYYKSTYRVLAFVVCTVLMVLSFPNSGRFNYEYEINRPWRYEDVIAPFDFPILKPESEVATERDSLMRIITPYYAIDSVYEPAIRLRVHAMVRAKAKLLPQYAPQGIDLDTLQAVLESSITSNVADVASLGIVDVGLRETSQLAQSDELMLIQGNVASPFRFDELTTPRRAYSEVLDRTAKDLRHFYGQENRRFRQIVAMMPISEVIEPNIYFDEAKTQAMVSQKVENINLYSGKVVAGQRIIGTGEMVTPPAAQKLLSLRAATTGGFSTNEHELPILTGQFIIVSGLMLSLFLFLCYFRNDYFRQLHFINFILVLITMIVCATGFLARLGANISYIIPFVILPVMMRIFTDARLGMYVHIVTILIVSFFAYNSQVFIFTHIPAGLIACISLYQLNKRIQIFRTAVYILLYYCVTYTGFAFWQSAEFSFHPMVYIEYGVSATLFLLTYPLIYLIEKVFGFVSDVTLLEMADGNNALLRQLSEKAPGTFQHSMQVANLGQEVAYKIGANALLVRAGALYHDVGKILNPMLFTENQVQGVNPHDTMTYEQSAKLIIDHVRQGVELARRYHLPLQIRNIISSHHGTTMTRYFYLKWCAEHAEETPNLSDFTYPGPRPRTKEQAIIMMADAVEAASKSLTSHSDTEISNLVDKIIDSQMAAAQFHKAPITFAEIYQAREILKEKLRNIYHVRIQYPDNNTSKP